MAWYLAKVKPTDRTIDLMGRFDRFEPCWTEFRKYLSDPPPIEEGAIRVCEAADDREALRLLRKQLEEDIERDSALKGTPDRVVRRWLKTYGVDMASAAALTTDSLRGGRPVEQWVAEETKKLQQVGFNPGEGRGRILRNEIAADEATVVVSRTVSTKDGPKRIEETFKLVRRNGRWLIDEVEMEEKAGDD